jgi:prepilin-type N-terminal cleavage/methylation domain-containing protein
MRRSTFTLIEMLVVICILLILMGLGAAGVNKVLQNNAKKQTVLGVRAVVAACEQYKNRWGSLPYSAAALTASANATEANRWVAVDFGSILHDGGGAAGGSAKNKLFIDYGALELDNSTATAIKDYWGNNLWYKYTAAGDYIEVRSIGPDATRGNTDDILSSGP